MGVTASWPRPRIPRERTGETSCVNPEARHGSAGARPSVGRGSPRGAEPPSLEEAGGPYRGPPHQPVTREYPDYPRVGVGAVVLSRGRVLLVRRGKPPGEGRWSLPGGLVDLGETSVDAARREVEEECGITVRIAGLAGVLDRVTRDAGGRVRYHWVLVDYLAFPESDDDTIIAGDDAAEVRWVPINEVDRMLTTDGLMDMIRRAAALAPGGGV